MYEELVALRERVEKLERETIRLRRQRWWTLGVFGAVLLVVGSPLGRTEDGAQNLTCRSLRVVDEAGSTRVSLDIQSVGGLSTAGRVMVAGADGKARAVLGVDHDSGFTDWYGGDGKPRATLFTAEDGNARLHLSGPGKGPDPVVKALLGGAKDGGFVGVSGNDGASRLYGSVDNNAGYLGWYGPDGKVRTSVSSTPAGEAQLRLADRAGKVHAFPAP